MQPLAERLRPKNLSEFIGQNHLIGKQGIIYKLVKNPQFFPSLILWGPPGVGKTTLARIIANKIKRPFFEFSAVNTKTAEIQKILDLNPIVFLDEIHRFNKAQQDKLLPQIEKGNLILIGATTENPSFEVIPALLSRCRVLVLNNLDGKDLKKIEKRALNLLKLKIERNAEKFLLDCANGDARILINTLEIGSQFAQNAILTVTDIETAFQKRALSFDKNGDNFYDSISSYIKSMRAGDVDAALYYLARMVASGQDPIYIARRMVVFASEDVASPTALVVANAVFQACQLIGLPECQENLAAGTVYLSLAKKDRSAYDAYKKALDDVLKYGNLPIPLKIRNAPTKLMEELGYGKNYKMYDKKSLLPDKLRGRKYYSPTKGS